MNKEPRYHDPKVVPPPGESVEMAVEYTREELEQIDEAVRHGGFWSRAELFRAASQAAVKEFRSRRKR
jgi:metal-responsive CopG/Arc/MetJ family transcriptional regulator